MNLLITVNMCEIFSYTSVFEQLKFEIRVISLSQENSSGYQEHRAGFALYSNPTLHYEQWLYVTAIFLIFQ